MAENNNLRNGGILAGVGALIVGMGVAVFGGQNPAPPPAASPPEVVAQAPPVAPAPPSAPTEEPTPPVTAETPPPAPAPTPVVPATAAPAVAQVADAPVAPPPRRSRAVRGVAEVPSANFEFIVAFKPTHPMAQALRLSAENKDAEAEALAKRLLVRRKEFAGLCFQGFTLAGAEVVLTLCEPVPDSKAESASRQWENYIRTKISGVAYADRNVTLQPGAKP
jgi:type IV secretory pathway VirB10-like protein